MEQHHNQRQMLHLGMQLQKASGLSKEPVLEPRLGVHRQENPAQARALQRRLQHPPPATAGRSNRAHFETGHRTSDPFSSPALWHRSPRNQSTRQIVCQYQALEHPCFHGSLKRLRRASPIRHQPTPGGHRPPPQTAAASAQRHGLDPAPPTRGHRRTGWARGPLQKSVLPPCRVQSPLSGAGRGTHRSSHRARAAHRVAALRERRKSG